jgi:hypothetical protein
MSDESIFCLTRAEQSQLQTILTLKTHNKMRRGNQDPRALKSAPSLRVIATVQEAVAQSGNESKSAAVI